MTSQSALRALLSEVAQLNAADQEAIFRALPVAQARALHEHLASAATPVGFAAALRTQASSQAASEALQALAHLDLEAVPAGVAATLLADVPADERNGLLQGLSAERAAKLRALLADLPDRSLSQASARLRDLLQDGPFVRAAPAAAARPQAQQAWPPASLRHTLGNWIRSWSHV